MQQKLEIMDAFQSPPPQLTNIQEDYHALRGKYKELQEMRTNVRKLEDHCKAEVTKLKAQVHVLQDKIHDSSFEEEAREINEGLLEMSSTFAVAPNTLFLRLIIGDIPLTLANKLDKVTYKQKYEKFKMVNVVCLFILSVIGLIFSDYVLPSSLVHILSVWYYFTVTIRELVLLGNGSRIKLWWLLHHYCSIAIATLLLTWPPGECYTAFKNQFMLFTCCLSFVMGLQFRYQRAKLYREVALGKKHHMAISQGMKIDDLRFLVGCLIGIYIFQFYNGYVLLSLYFSSTVDCPHWQVLVLGVLFIVIACMNGSTLRTVIVGKGKPKQNSRNIERHKSF